MDTTDYYFKARHGTVWPGRARSCEVRFGMAWSSEAWLGIVWHGMTRNGVARRGGATRGSAWHGKVEQGTARCLY